MRIYLDHNATTPLDPMVTERMTQALREVWGNASSVHHFGQQAKAALDEARGSVAALLAAEASEIVFTAGGTESDNLAMLMPGESPEFCRPQIQWKMRVQRTLGRLWRPQLN